MNDFSSPEHGYSMSQGGNLQRFNKVTGHRESIRPVHPDGGTLRSNWNAGLTVDPIAWHGTSAAEWKFEFTVY